MINILLLIVVPVLLVTLGFGQASPATTTTTTTTTDQASIKGCLTGSAGNYTVAQDGTPQVFKLTTSAVDLKPHLGHDVELTGKRVSAPGFGVTDSTLAVTAVKMISEHCATTAAATTPSSADPITATVTTPAAATPPATASSPAAADPATATITTSTVTTPAATPMPAPADSVAPAATSTTVTTTVATKAPAAPASTPVMASASAPLPNTPTPSTKATKVTGKLGDDGKTFVSDTDSKSWAVTNPEAVKGHEGHHVILTAHIDADKGEVHVVSLKMVK